MKDKVDAEIALKARKVKLLILDVDGVMTDGRIIIDSQGKELKFFDVKDGHGIKLFIRAGFDVVIITGRESNIVISRARELGIKDVYQGIHNKSDLLEHIIRGKGLNAEEVAYIGDDLTDIPVMRRVGFAVAVKDSVEEVKQFAHYITDKKGGRGAIREVVELILKSQEKWDDIIKKYLI